MSPSIGFFPRAASAGVLAFAAEASSQHSRRVFGLDRRHGRPLYSGQFQKRTHGNAPAALVPMSLQPPDAATDLRICFSRLVLEICLSNRMKETEERPPQTGLSPIAAIGREQLPTRRELRGTS